MLQLHALPFAFATRWRAIDHFVGVDRFIFLPSDLNCMRIVNANRSFSACLLRTFSSFSGNRRQLLVRSHLHKLLSGRAEALSCFSRKIRCSKITGDRNENKKKHDPLPLPALRVRSETDEEQKQETKKHAWCCSTGEKPDSLRNPELTYR